MLELRQKRGDGGGWEIKPESGDPHTEIVRLLREACEIEHALMLQYLYAAYSVKPNVGELVGHPRTAATPEKASLLGVAIDEMVHLRTVNEVLVAMGEPPHLGRPSFPLEPTLYPFRMDLAPLSEDTVAQYMYMEAPAAALDPNGNEPAVAIAVLDRLPGDARDPTRQIGSLYRRIESLMREWAFAGGPAEHILHDWIPKLEGVRSEGEGEHYQFFRTLFLSRVWCENGGPSVPLPTNPTAHELAPRGFTAETLAVGRVANRAYWAVLVLLDRAYGMDRPDLAPDLASIGHDLMVDVLHPLAGALARAQAGMPFDPAPTDLVPSIQTAADLLTNALEILATLPGEATPEIDDARVALCGLRERIRHVDRIRNAVVVVGSGPAGLAAALALSARGIPTRVLERGSVIGGKVYSEQIDVEVEIDCKKERRTLSLEHGVHGWWPGYVNFFHLLEACGVNLETTFLTEKETHLVTDDGIHTMKPSERSLPSPIFLAMQILGAKYLGGLPDLLRMIPFTIHVLAFQHEDDYEAYDRESLEHFLERLGVPAAAQHYLFRPFALNLDYALPHEISASSVLSAFQFYALPSEESLLPRWTRGLPEHVVFGPMAEQIEKQGGRVDRSFEVLGVETDGGRLTGVRTETRGIGSEPTREPVAFVRPDELREDDFTAVEARGGGHVFVRRDGNDVCAFSDVCTHQGGTLEWSDGRFVCRRHKGQFGSDGAVLSSPPSRDLGKLKTKERDGRFAIYGTTRRFTIPCHHAILATDLTAARAILGAPGPSRDLLADLVADLEHLKTSSILVVRMWFPKGTPLTVGDQPTAVTPDAEIVDNYFHLNAFDASYDREGEVVEIQGCREESRWGPDKSDEEVVRRVLADLRDSGLFRADVPRPFYTVVTRHPDLFTKYAPGSVRYRPGADSGIHGLQLSGDWTRADWSAWFMERAVISGLRAANRVLESRGKKPYPIRRVPPEGTLLSVSRWVARGVRDVLGLRPRRTPPTSGQDR